MDFIKLIKRHCSKQEDIAEVGAGYGYDSRELINSGYKVTIYDKEEKKYKLDGITIIYEKFTENTENKFSFVFAKQPCEGTLDIIKYAIRNKIKFVVALCCKYANEKEYNLLSKLACKTHQIKIEKKGINGFTMPVMIGIPIIS